MIIISCVLYAIALFLLIFIAPIETKLGTIMNVPTMLEAVIAILIGNVFTIMWYLDGKFENFYRDADIKPKKKEPQDTETDNSSGGVFFTRLFYIGIIGLLLTLLSIFCDFGSKKTNPTKTYPTYTTDYNGTFKIN